MPDIINEIIFKTARSGGKGGQNVNKVETMVEGYWSPDTSQLFTPEEIDRIKIKLAAKITAAGFLQARSQTARTQLENRTATAKKMNELVAKALIVPKRRRATKPSKAVKAKRMESKKQASEIKSWRKKVSI